MLSVLLRIYRKEGVAGLYRGFGATMLNTFSMRKQPMTSPVRVRLMPHHPQSMPISSFIHLSGLHISNA